MKQALIRWHGRGEPVEHILLSTLEEVTNYISMVSSNTVHTLTHLLSNSIPKERWDHYAQKGDWGNSFNIAMEEVNLKGGNPIYTVDSWTQKKLLNMSEQLIKGYQIVVNSNGGWCLLDSSMHEVIETYDFEPKEMQHYKIKENTQYLNLENDYDLEKRTIEYLTPLDENFSYICGLRDYSRSSWLQIFKEFKEKGGHTIYVYTTGSDHVQMFEYGLQIIEAGIKNVVFEFNAGLTEEILQNIKYLKEVGIDVRLVKENGDYCG